MSACFPIRSVVQLTQGYIALADIEQLVVKQNKPIPKFASLHYFKNFNFGRIQSALGGVELCRTLATFPGMSTTQYLASFANNSLNAQRHMLFLPFTCQKFQYHSRTDSFLVVSSVERYEVRPYRSITIDEVANIRLFQTVDNKQGQVSKEELIALCQRIIPRDPAPFNSHSVIDHQHLFLVESN